MSEIMRYETDIVRIIHDNQTGQACRVKPDGDGLGLVEIEGGDDFGRLTLAPEMALVIAQAMLRCANEMLGRTSRTGRLRRNECCRRRSLRDARTYRSWSPQRAS